MKKKIKIEVGDYVKIADGTITKVTSLLFDNIYYFDKSFETDKYYELVNSLNDSEIKDNIVKSSKDIIDLIEIGDIVETFDVLNNDIIYIWSEEMLKALKEDVENGIQIKSIVTKEQFEKMKYNVERRGN